MTLDEWVKWGKDNKYLVELGGKFKSTNDLNRDYASRTINIGGSSSGQLAITTSTTQVQVSKPTFGNIEGLYRQYQLDAQVPFRIKTDNGSEFTVRTKSKAAILKFIEILTRGDINYQGLVLATRFYYANNKLFRKPLAKFIEEDIWQSYYDEVMSKAEEGILDKYVKDVVNPSSKFGREF